MIYQVNNIYSILKGVLCSYSEAASSCVDTLPLIMLTVIIIILVVVVRFMDNGSIGDESHHSDTGDINRDRNNMKAIVVIKMSRLWAHNCLHRSRNSVHGPYSTLNPWELNYLARHCGILGAHVSPNYTIHRNGGQLIPTRRDVYRIIRWFPTG